MLTSPERVTLAAEIVSFPFVSVTVIAPLVEILSASGSIFTVGATGTCGFSTVTVRLSSTITVVQM